MPFTTPLGRERAFLCLCGRGFFPREERAKIVFSFLSIKEKCEKCSDFLATFEPFFFFKPFPFLFAPSPFSFASAAASFDSGGGGGGVRIQISFRPQGGQGKKYGLPHTVN